MKFKKDAIKPEMVIHCPKEEDARALSEYLIKLGAVNANRIMEYYGSDNGVGKIDTVLITRREGKLYVEYSDRRWFEKDEYHMKITEFSDLIEPDENLANKANDLANSLDNQDNDLDNQQDNEISAVEVLEWLDAVKRHPDAMEEAFGVDTFGSIFDCNTPRKITEKITAYKAAKKVSKPIEYEWGDVITLYDLGDKVVSRFVPLSEDYKDEMKALLKEYVENYKRPVSALYVTHGAGLRVKEES